MVAVDAAKTWAVRSFQAAPPISRLPGSMVHAERVWIEERGQLFFWENLHRATRASFGSLRHVLFLKQPWRKHLRLPLQLDPKHEAA
ncbi:MAG: hypothetical protein ACLGQH_13545 [Acidobacteriota bacterium]